MPVTYVIVGVAGAGKTSKAMEIIEEKLRGGLKWNEIGFASFSRAACQEAARRASVITGVDVDRLQKEGHFKTLHAMAYRGLGLDSKSVIDHDSKTGRDFLTECCGTSRGGEKGTLGEKIDVALSWWETERLRLSRIVQPHDPEVPSIPIVSVGHKVGTANLDLLGQKSQQIQGFAAGYSGCPTQTVPVFFDAARDNPSVFDGSESSLSIPIGDNKNLLLSNSRSAADRHFCGAGGAVHEIKPLCRVHERSYDCGGIYRLSGFPVGQLRSGAAKPEHEVIIRQFEDAKRYSGMLDFTDILMRFAGFEADSDLNFRRCYPMGSVPSEIQVVMLDEYQDCSVLLDYAAERLAFNAGELWILGDKYQSVYAFAGSDHRVFEAREELAKTEGKRVLLNRSYRNPNCVIEWGEQVLREDADYEERKPYSEKWDGSVGMMESRDFMSCLPEIATTDSMILCRTWFGLGKVKDRLDELAIPWTSCQEKRSSVWDCPVKIAIVLTMQALRDGDKISEQDFRRLTENFPMKYDGLELFKRGEKARWKKLECSGELVFGLDRVEEWGAGSGFRDFVLEEKWRHDQYLLLSVAMEKWGIDVVRSPRIKLGSCHSVKGMQAENVFCLATSSEKASQSGFWEDLFLKYVTITRASKHYRVVVDLVEHGRGRKLFLPCPKGFWSFTKGLPDGFGKEGIEDPERDHQDAEQTAEHLGSEIPSVDLRDDRSAGHSGVFRREVCGPGGQDGGREAVGDADVAGEEDSFSEWDIGRSSKFG